jgi:hypothetical protein
MHNPEQQMVMLEALVAETALEATHNADVACAVV